MRRLLSIFLLMIFCIQLLPLSCIGKILYSQSLQEEIPHTDDKPVKSGNNPEIVHAYNLHPVINNITYQRSKHLFVHPSESILLAHWLETFSPPPEFS